jgi:hypothetical protein
MTEVRYVFGNLLTGEVLEEIPCSGVSFNDSLDGGDFQASFNLDQSGHTNDDLVAATLPGLRYVVVERDRLPVWGGIIWSRTYQSQAKAIQIFAKTFDQYPTRRIYESTTVWTDIEQRNIFLSLWTSMLSDPSSPPIILPGTFLTTQTKSLSVAASDLKVYRSLMDELAATDNGFEWRVAVVRNGGGYNFNLVVGDPFLGMPLNDTSVVFEYPGAILNYWRNDTIASSGTNIFGIGSGEGDSMPTVEVIHADLLENGWPRWDFQVSFKGVDDLNTVENLTQQQAALRKGSMPIYTVEMKGDLDPAFGDWGIGDGCQLVFRDPLHGEGFTKLTRILKYEYTPPSGDATEEVRVTFEGDDDAS